MFNLDIKSFVKHFRAFPVDIIFENLIKYGLSPTLKVFKGWEQIPEWPRFFKKLLEEDSFVLIILDSCRYDFFCHSYGRYLCGRLIALKSLGPDTYDWFSKVFAYQEFRDLRLFYARLKIKSHDIRLEGFIPHNRNVDAVAIWPNKAKPLKTVLPEEVRNEVIRRGLSKRNIIWYMQPHFPWICEKELSLQLMKEVTWQDFFPKDLVKQSLKEKGIQGREIVKAYISNLEAVLKSVSSLIKEIKKSNPSINRIIITSDHGDLLGDYGLYLHPHYALPQLYIVPWLEISC